jgi:serine/threonine protein kinase
MAAWKHSGRASDMFSLACVLLEIVVIHTEGTLQRLRLNRSADPAFHANLDRVDAWFVGSLPKKPSSRRVFCISEIKSMLARDPEARPTAKELLARVTGYDLARIGETKLSKTRCSLFGDCCRNDFVASKKIESYTDTIDRMSSDLQRAHEELAQKEGQMNSFVKERTALIQRFYEERVSFVIGSTEKLQQKNPNESKQPNLSTLQKKTSASEWQFEKQRLERRIAELELFCDTSLKLPMSLLPLARPPLGAHGPSAPPPPPATQGPRRFYGADRLLTYYPHSSHLIPRSRSTSPPSPVMGEVSQSTSKPRKKSAHAPYANGPPDYREPKDLSLLDAESDYDRERRRRRQARKEAKSREIMGLE